MHQLIFVAAMTKVEFSLVMQLYKQINELQHDNLLLNNRVWELKDDIYELETENRVLKTELLNSLRNVEIGVFMPLGKGETSANLLDVRIFGVTAEAAGKLSLALMGQPSWNQAAAAKLASTVESVELDTFEMCKQVYPAS